MVSKKRMRRSISKHWLLFKETTRGFVYGLDHVTFKKLKMKVTSLFSVSDFLNRPTTALIL